MLLGLLRLLSNSSGIASLPEIARKLGMSEGLLARILDDSVRLGYLSLARDDCGTPTCPACATRGSCLAGTAPRLWFLTEKGRRLLESHPA